jgi:hypothetical protein
LQDGNERQDPVNQKHPELIQIQKKWTNDEKQISTEYSED